MKLWNLSGGVAVGRNQEEIYLFGVCSTPVSCTWGWELWVEPSG